MKKIILIPAYEPDNRLIELIKEIDKNMFDVIVINDGSGDNYKNIFNEVSKYVKLIEYDKNMGKGYALKTGFKYIKENYSDNYVVVTMDSDGQHTIRDAVNLCDYVEEHPSTLVLGMRKRSGKTPLRSRIGNGITKFVFSIVTGIDIYDTQTGLRAFTNNIIDNLIGTKGDRFEYELNCLLELSRIGIDIHEIEIETIYIDNNSGSHFSTFRDSFIIYRDIFKFSLSSIYSFIIDYILYIIFNIIFNNLVLSNAMARIISGSFNYTVNRKMVFNSHNKVFKSVLSYIILAIFILICNTILLSILVNYLSINKYISKILVEIILFIVSYIIQIKVIFKKSK